VLALQKAASLWRDWQNMSESEREKQGKDIIQQIYLLDLITDPPDEESDSETASGNAKPTDTDDDADGSAS
jgi:hypothetical protein